MSIRKKTLTREEQQEYQLVIGRFAEDTFCKAAHIDDMQRGYNDVYEHKDLIVNGKSYDIKAPKSMTESSANSIVVEFVSVNNMKGWIDSDVDEIAQMIRYHGRWCFFFLPRKGLRDMVLEKVPDPYNNPTPATAEHEPYVCYARASKHYQDRYVYVPLADLIQRFGEKCIRCVDEFIDNKRLQEIFDKYYEDR